MVDRCWQRFRFECMVASCRLEFQQINKAPLYFTQNQRNLTGMCVVQNESFQEVRIISTIPTYNGAGTDLGRALGEKNLLS